MEKNIAQTASQKIYFIRGHRVMLDSDLAQIYEIETYNLNKAVKRNAERFPADFMFQLNAEELESLIFQSGISKRPGRGGRRHLPYVFTQEGVAMLSGILSTPRAIQANIEIMRAFVRLRVVLGSHRELAEKLAQLEKKYDAQFRVVFDAIRNLMAVPDPSKRRIGFKW